MLEWQKQIQYVVNAVSYTHLKSLKEVSKTIAQDSSVLIAVSDKKAQFWIGETVIQTRLIDGAYPETARLIPTEFAHELTVDSRDMLNACLLYPSPLLCCKPEGQSPRIRRNGR